MSYLLPPLINASVNNILYPLTYTKTLMQLGYEPLQPYKAKKFGYFGKSVLLYPNGFAYMKYIAQTDGILGLGRGFGSRIVCDLTFRLVQDRGTSLLMTACGKDNTEEGDQGKKKEGSEDLTELVEECAIESCSKMVAIVVSQPFYVISVRAMAQFVGKENIYGIPFISAFGDMWKHDGIAGFFAGLIPRAISEILSLWLGKILYYLMCKYVFVEDNKQAKTLQPYGRLLTPSLTSYVTYPFALTSTIMAVNGSSLRIGNFPYTPVYSGWIACLKDLIVNKETDRGAKLFIRLAKT